MEYTTGQFIDSEYNVVVSLAIRKKYRLPFEAMKIFDSIVRAVYAGGLPVADAPKRIGAELKLDSGVAANVAIDLLGMRVLPATEVLDKQVAQDTKDFLAASGVDEARFAKTVAEFKQAIQEEADGTYDHDKYLYGPDEPAQPKRAASEEAEDIGDAITDDMEPRELLGVLKNFLQDNLAFVLDPEVGDTLNEINHAIAITLVDDESRSGELALVLENNALLIGTRSIVQEGKSVPQSCSAWLKDYYQVIGTDHFDALSIARYFIESANAKQLSEAEQQTLRRFLLFYHNVKTFPEPFASFPPEQWHIIPTVSDIEQAPATEQPPVSISRAQNPVQSKVGVPKNEIPAASPVSSPAVQKRVPASRAIPSAAAPEPVKAPAIARKPSRPVAQTPSVARPQASAPESEELLNLKNMLLQFPAGSLERTAIEEEIRKMENN